MSEWTPGRRVLTDADKAAWQHWRRESKREAQRERRARYPRIDYYPDDDANELIRSLTRPIAGYDFSSIINRIVSEWSEGVPPE